MADKKNNEDIEFEVVPCHTPTTATDFINIAKREDGGLIFQLLSWVPEKIYENHRTVVSTSHVRELIDSLCEIENYYPTKPMKKIAKKKASTKKKANK